MQNSKSVNMTKKMLIQPCPKSRFPQYAHNACIAKYCMQHKQ